MKLLASKLYDPGTAETKATSSLLALTAMDTTNLRNSFTIPSHGMVLVKMRGVIHGATTLPAILLGILDGSTIRGRIAPIQIFNTVPATGLISIEATFSMSGLTPGAVSWDAAYGVETVVASSAIKYGGPNDTTGNNAFGGFLFEVWDPAPQPTNFSLMTIDGSGIVDADVRQWLGTAVATPTVAGVPEVDITHISGDAQSATDLKDFSDAGYDPATNKVQGVVLTDTLTTYTGNTVQTGDSFARIGVAGAGLTAIPQGPEGLLP